MTAPAPQPLEVPAAVRGRAGAPGTEHANGRGTRAAILAAAARLFAEQGYRGTHLRAVAAEVGIQKATIFHHFANKRALYAAVVDQGRGETEAIVGRFLGAEGGWRERARALLGAYVDLVAAHPEQTKILLRQSLGDAPEGWAVDHDADRLLVLATAFIAEGQRAGAFVPLDPVTLILGVVGMVAFLFTAAPMVAPRWGLDVDEEERVARIRRHVVEVFERALVGGAAPPA